MRRLLPILLILPLAACEPVTMVGVGAGAAVLTLPLTGRAPPDLVVSALSGRDCSVVRLDRGLSYCAPTQAPPAPPPYCTRSLGQVDCWVSRPPMLGPPFAHGPGGVADGPASLTPAQEADRTARWPAAF